jgi:hypothetical protein
MRQTPRGCSPLPVCTLTWKRGRGFCTDSSTRALDRALSLPFPRFPQHLRPLFPARFRTRGIRRPKRRNGFRHCEMFAVIEIITQLSAALRRVSQGRNDQGRSPIPPTPAPFGFSRRAREGGGEECVRRAAPVQTKETKELKEWRTKWTDRLERAKRFIVIYLPSPMRQ